MTKTTNACDKCGAWCCKTFVGAFSPKNKDRIEFFAQRAEQIIYKDDLIYFILKAPCPKLDENDRCSIYKDRPEMCRRFPSKEYKDWIGELNYCKLVKEKIKEK